MWLFVGGTWTHKTAVQHLSEIVTIDYLKQGETAAHRLKVETRTVSIITQKEGSNHTQEEMSLFICFSLLMASSCSWIIVGVHNGLWKLPSLIGTQVQSKYEWPRQLAHAAG